MPQQDQRYLWYRDFANTTCPTTSGCVFDYVPCVQPTRRTPDLPSPTRATSSSPRRRERCGSRRHSTRGGPDEGDNPADPEPSGDQAGRRFCAGCGRSIDHLRADARACSARCRQRRHRHPDPLNRGLAADAYLGLAQWEWESLRARALEACRCNGGPVSRAGYRRDESYLLDSNDGVCAKCGYARRVEIAPYYVMLWKRQAESPSYIKAASAEVDHDRPLEAVIA